MIQEIKIADGLCIQDWRVEEDPETEGIYIFMGDYLFGPFVCIKIVDNKLCGYDAESALQGIKWK